VFLVVVLGGEGCCVGVVAERMRTTRERTQVERLIVLLCVRERVFISLSLSLCLSVSLCLSLTNY